MDYKHPFGKAIMYTIVLCAVMHLSLSFFYGAVHGDIDTVNMFHVLGLDLFWPSLGTGTLNAALGVVMIVGAWAAVGALLYWRERRIARERKPAKKPKGE